MELRDYFYGLESDDREDYAKRSGTTVAYLIQLIGGHRRPGTELAKALSRESGNEVTLPELRPDVWDAA